MVLHKSSLKVTVHKHDYLSCWLLSTGKLPQGKCCLQISRAAVSQNTHFRFLYEWG